MLERFESRPSRLAIRDARALPTGASEACGAGSIMRLPYGDVAADFKAIAMRGRRHRSACYELLVANDTPAPLATFAYAPDASSHGRLTWNAIVVPPFSAIAVEIDVALGRSRPRPRVVAELFADDAQLTLDAPAPRDLPARARRGVAAVVAGCAMLVGAVAFTQVRPHVLALAAPATVHGGTPFSVAYALGAGEGGRYVVETPDGLQVQRGALDSRSGAFTIALPQAPRSLGYDVRVTTSGRFGIDERTTHVVALPDRAVRRPARAVARSVATAIAGIGDFALERDTVHGGQPIVATYRASDTTGFVRLIDAYGTVRAEALLTPRGRSILVAPGVETDQDFRVVATVERGATHAEAAAAVTILHGAAPVAGAVPGTTARATAPGVIAARGAAPVAVDPVQEAARPIVVRIVAYRPKLHVALMGASTDEVSGSDVAPGDTSVVLHPPERLAETHYAVVATYATGLGQETLIRPITFREP